jgi:hypothetical protein
MLFLLHHDGLERSDGTLNGITNFLQLLLGCEQVLSLQANENWFKHKVEKHVFSFPAFGSQAQVMRVGCLQKEI